MSVFSSKEITGSYEDLLSSDKKDFSSPIVNAADKLAAYIKCLEELKSGNEEFKHAAKQTYSKLKSLDMQEVDYFLEKFIPAFELTIDELEL